MYMNTYFAALFAWVVAQVKLSTDFDHNKTMPLLMLIEQNPIYIYMYNWGVAQVKLSTDYDHNKTIRRICRGDFRDWVL